MEHTWDGDLEEYNNPLPRWWLWLFYITDGLRAGLPAALSRPGQLGKGMLGWSSGPASTSARSNAAEACTRRSLQRFAAMPVPELAPTPRPCGPGTTCS
jgi:cytochrome c oxidase cbb3-type subunit III